MRGWIVVDRNGGDIPPAVQDAQNSEPFVVLPEIDPVLAENAEPYAWRHAIPRNTAVPEAGKIADMIENPPGEILGSDDVRRGDIVEYIVEITPRAWSQY